ncbi:MAG: hypothetical protein AB7F88_10495 [Pyrinomonadaceae bacterium]
MTKNIITTLAFMTAVTLGAQAAAGQFTIKLPDVSIKGKPVKTDGRKNSGNDDTTRKNTGAGDKTPDGNVTYPAQRPTGTPVLMKNTLYIQAITHNEYWKMPKERNYSSWVPKLRFSHFFDNGRKLNYTVEYFNPDGSAWYSEKLEQSSRIAGDRTVLFESPSPWGGVIDTKSTAAVGVFGFKITDDDSKEVLFQGKFKVGKFGTTYNPREKHKAGFYVDHDWLMAFGRIGFHHSVSEIGGMPLLVSFWFKEPVEAAELEARVFFKGNQIATTANNGGGVGSFEERYADAAPAFAADKVWKRWQFQWTNFLVDSNGTFNRANFPEAFFADKNPGEYTVKVYRAGAQVRELTFTVGADGKFVVPAYSSQVFMPYYRLLFPVKTAGAEKFNANAYKTEAFYGNPLKGF